VLLSVCLITKNEEQFLAGCLDSVRAAAGEIILVDTGSADRTVEIARSYGCRVLHRAWDDDFSAARNAGLAVARGRWILCLDADERLAHSALLPAAIAEAKPDVGGFLIERHDAVIHPEDGQSDVYPVEILRLFRNRPDIRYEGIVHERPNETVLRAGLEIRSLASLKLGLKLGLKLTHLVSHLPQDRLEAKQQRYLRLLDLELEQDGRNFWAHYSRGKTLWFLRRLEEARSVFRGIVEDEGCSLSLRASAWCMLAALLSEEGLRGAAVECVQESLALIPEQSLAYYVLAEILYADGRFAHAREAYRRVRRSMDPESAPGQILGDLCMTREKRGYKLGCCSLALGEIAEAESQFLDGLSGNPSHGGCHYGLARAALLRGDRRGAIEHLEDAVKNDPAWKTPRELLAELNAEAAQPPATTAGSSIRIVPAEASTSTSTPTGKVNCRSM
jgi:tetratricopeptide (TPR) repeat protein